MSNPQFWGYPAEVIADWCAVSLRTAIDIKSGRKPLSPRTKKLFDLHRKGKILGPEWDGWQINRDQLVSDWGNWSVGDLRALHWIIQLHRKR